MNLCVLRKTLEYGEISSSDREFPEPKPVWSQWVAWKPRTNKLILLSASTYKLSTGYFSEAFITPSNFTNLHKGNPKRALTVNLNIDMQDYRKLTRELRKRGSLIIVIIFLSLYSYLTINIPIHWYFVKYIYRLR